jgi:sigma-B regulation protein RsbU (phosphoserine phosphatase)
MATCRSALRSLAENCDSPAKAFVAVYRQLFPDMREDMFISMVDMILEDESDRLRFACAGHEAPLMFRQATSEGEILKPGGLAIGIPSREGGIWGAVVGRG